MLTCSYHAGDDQCVGRVITLVFVCVRVSALYKKKNTLALNIKLGTQHTLWREDEQVALLWQRDRATRLSVEILQLQNNPFED